MRHVPWGALIGLGGLQTDVPFYSVSVASASGCGVVCNILSAKTAVGLMPRSKSCGVKQKGEAFFIVVAWL